MKFSLKKLGLFASVGLMLVGAGIVGAQVVLPTVTGINPGDVFLDVPNGVPSASSVYATAAQMRSYDYAQNSQHLTTPTLTVSGSTCGGNTAVISGTDVSGQVTEGSSASTSCVVVFATAFATAPECFVSINNVADAALKCSASTNAITITQGSTNSVKLNYEVVGLPGG